MDYSAGISMATFMPYIYQPLGDGEDGHNGSVIAHVNLLRWGVLVDQLKEVCLLFGQEAGGIRSLESFHKTAVRSINKSLPPNKWERISIDSIPAFVARGNLKDFIFLGKVHQFSQLSQLRSTLRIPFPICCIVHSVPFSNLYANYLSLILQASPQDLLIATSTAAYGAVESLLNQTVESIRTRFPEITRLPLPRIERLPLGVDDDFLVLPSRESARTALEIPDSKIVVLYLGRLSKEYKADLKPLLQAVKLGRLSFPSLHLIVAGSDLDRYAAEVARDVTQLQLDEHVLILSKVPPYLKTLLYAAADVFVSPVDNIQESFGITILEAMAAGLSVLASNWSGYRDLVKDGRRDF